MMKILGLHINTGQTAAAFLVEGEIKAAAAEERFDRIKLSRAFPKKAIEYGLSVASVKSVDKLDGIAISWNPAENMRNINLSGFTQWRRYDPEWLYIVPNNIMGIAGKDAFPSEMLKMELSSQNQCPIYFVEHHRAHLAHAIAQSPFESGLAVIADEYGEFNSVTIAVFDRDRYDIIKRIAYPNSLGVFYAAITEYLGFVPNSDEWKVMGAAAYGNATSYLGCLEKLLIWDELTGEWILDGRYIEHSNMKRAGYCNEQMGRLIGIPPRNAAKALEQQHYDLAAAAQTVFEKRLFQLLSYYAKHTGEKKLAASGGCFMNSLANGRIITNTPFKQIFIPYAAADNGGAMGAALHLWHYGMHNLRVISKQYPTPYLGPAFSDMEIKETLDRYKLRYSRHDDIAVTAAQAIADGKLVGWFQGRMEFGERALGNRSILADPRDGGMKDRINAAVKYREAFRPFAPSILAEKVKDYFDIPDDVFVPYMEQVYPIREEKRSKIPAVVHADGTGRLQMVSYETNILFYELIKEFEKLAGIPLVLNTSFNIQGEPIVCSPTDAIRTFYSCGLDMLIIGSFIVEKNNDRF